MNKLAISSVLTMVLAGAAHADLVEVKGTAVLGGEHSSSDPTRLASIGFPVAEGDTIEFSYAYESSTNSGETKHFVVKNPSTGLVLDFLDVGVSEKPLSVFGHDQYEAFADSTVNGHQTALEVLLLSDFDLLSQGPGAYLNQLEKWTVDGKGAGHFYIGVDIACPEGLSYCIALDARITSLSATVTATPPPPPADADGDGVPDSADQCGGSSSGLTDANGCTIHQLVPCAGPKGGGTWRNHGKYVAEMAKQAQAWYEAGLITEDEKDAIIAGAANTTCGK